jgi:hypothetical protein
MERTGAENISTWSANCLLTYARVETKLIQNNLGKVTPNFKWLVLKLPSSMTRLGFPCLRIQYDRDQTMIITFKIESKPETSDRPIEAQIRPIWAGKMKFG